MRMIACLLCSLYLFPVYAAGPDAIATFDNGLQAAVYHPPGYIREGKGKQWPTILFSHGFAGSALSQDELLSKIASLGVLVLAVEHSDPVAFERIPPKKGDNRWKILHYMRTHHFTEKIYGYRPVEFAAFVKQALQRFPIDKHKMIFAGHSMGGYTIFNAVKLVDTKPCALIAYSVGEVNYKMGNPYFTPKQLAALKYPLLITYGEKEVDDKKGAYAQKIQQQYGGTSQIMMIKGGGHLSYNDPTRKWGEKKRLEQINVIFERTRKFLNEVLK